MKEASLITATVLFLSVVAGLFPQATWVDRVLLKDGTELYGLVFDQVPG